MSTSTHTQKGRLFVISGPSGVGKGTLVAAALQALPRLTLSVSATTRTPRPEDTEGLTYYFLTDEAFDELVATNQMLEWATVHGHRYGTPAQAVAEALDKGYDVILEIDTQGKEQVVERFPQAYSIFIAPPSIEILQKRLEHRATEDKETIKQRLSAAQAELEKMNSYDSVIVNEKVDKAASELIALISSERA